MGEIKFVKQARVWDPLQLPVGSAVRISGYSIENEQDFDRRIFLIKGHHWDEMKVTSTGGSEWTIFLHELEDVVQEQIAEMTDEEIESGFFPSLKIELLHKYEPAPLEIEDWNEEQQPADDVIKHIGGDRDDE